MTDEKLKKIFKNIPTDKFNPIRNTFGIGSLTALLVSMFNTVPVVDYSLLAVYILGYLSFSTMKNNRVIDFTRGFSELDDEYNLYLNNYRELMNSLDINSLAGLCASYYYLYKLGYLTIDDKFADESKEFFEGRRFQLVNIFNGCGVCRHKSNALKDILNTCGYPTAGLPIYTRTYESYTKEDIENMRKYIYSLFEDMGIEDNMKDQAADALLNMEVLFHQIDLNSEISSDNYSKAKKRLAKNVGNHLTVITSDNNESIVYDPTDNCFYQFKDKKSIDIINEYGIRMEFRLSCIGTANTPSEEKILFKNLKLHPMSLVGLRDAQDEAVKRLEENLDCVEKFKKENLPLMQSLRDKAYKLVI